jgi:hypothetical protein
MTEHIIDEQISELLDGQLPDSRRIPLESHLRTCALCRKEINSFLEIKSRLVELPRRFAPPQLIEKLKKTHLSPTLRTNFWGRLSHPMVLRPIGAFAIGLLLVGLWLFTHRPKETIDFVDLDPLLAAHARYRTETLLRQGDLDRSDFSARLASYYKDENN